MERFVKNKDLISKKIEQISRKEELVIAKLKQCREHVYLIEPFLENIDSALAKLRGYDLCSLVVYNTKENLDTVIKNWDKLAVFKRHFSIVFVNPFSKTEKRWIVYPMTHDMLTDKAGLKPGLMALFSNVEVISMQGIEKILTNNK